MSGALGMGRLASNNGGNPQHIAASLNLLMGISIKCERPMQDLLNFILTIPGEKAKVRANVSHASCVTPARNR